VAVLEAAGVALGGLRPGAGADPILCPQGLPPDSRSCTVQCGS
jgi:hypothetical protein